MTIDAEILAALRAAGPGALSAAELAQQLHLSRAAVWARIHDLRALGYDIAASPHLGYRLVSAPDRLHADDLLSRLGQTQVVGRDIQVFQETTSTNDVVEKLARDGVREGVVVFAESQTKGRGRLGRQWLSPAGQGLWFSVLLRPNFGPQEATRLTVGAATAVLRALQSQTGLSPAVKWPNDILIGGKKVAGILTELSAELDRVNYVILGIGVDVNLSQGDFPPELRRLATSLSNELGRPCDRAELAAEILRELDRDYARVCRGEFEAVAVEWEARCATLGREVLITVGDRQVRGWAEALDASGALLLRTQHGHLERIIGGDVTLAREPLDAAAR
jgi:BirA family biotin operon repressor/biotin-[acetyl-CoA-carboxylase] ligase